MNALAKFDLWLKRRETLRRLSHFDARLLGDMGIPAHDIKGYVNNVYRNKCQDKKKAERCAAPDRHSWSMPGLAAMPETRL